ncbi:unnamed protein product [Arabidopsis thaliana]|uniref:Serine/threonine-protein kinase BSK n=1 Tax=Arabidopsis thaliana TaxID=3702 RepID=A0A7G2DWU3_ARATH|nr:unnamed protein product [Arabidopsis thaliana]
MGCCQSSFLKPSSLHDKKITSDDLSGRRGKGAKRGNRHRHANINEGRGWHFSDVPDFSEFSASVLRDATNNFNKNAVVSVCSDQEPNLVYQGCIRSDKDKRLIAVKKFSKTTWPDPKQFATEARAIGSLRHSGLKLYHDLNTCRVLFDENGSPRLSCFGWMKNSKDGKNFSTNLAYTPPEYLRSGTLIPESVVFSFGTFLLDLLSGKHIPPSHAVGTIQKQNLNVLMDSHLEGNYPEEDAAMVFDLASKCLHNNPNERPEIGDIISVITTLQQKLDVPSYTMLGISKLEKLEMEHPKSLIYDACHQMDLAALHQILEAMEYKEDEVTYAALRDAMQAQCVYSDWPTAFYLQAVALSKLNMVEDSATMLKEALILEDKRGS